MWMLKPARTESLACHGTLRAQAICYLRMDRQRGHRHGHSVTLAICAAGQEDPEHMLTGAQS